MFCFFRFFVGWLGEFSVFSIFALSFVVTFSSSNAVFIFLVLSRFCQTMFNCSLLLVVIFFKLIIFIN